MGLTNQERINYNSKVLAANISSGQPTAQWYESIRPNFFILEDGQVLTQFSVVRSYPAANLATARNNVTSSLVGIVEDFSQFSSAVRLTEDIASNGFQYVALTTYNDFSSARLDKWIQPQKVPQSNGQPSIGYSIQLYDGDPASGGTLINTSDGQTGSGNTASVGWIFNYDTGTLLLSEDFKSTISDPYIVGFRYIGDTVADLECDGDGGSGDDSRYFFTTTQTSHGYDLGSQLVPVHKTTVSGWIPAQANSTDTLAVGFITNATDADTLEITLNGRVTVSGHDLLENEYYFLNTNEAGTLTSDTPISGVIQPVLWVEDEDIVIIKLERPNVVEEEPEEVILRIQGLEINVSGLEDNVDDLEARATALEFNAVQGGATASEQVPFFIDTNTVSGVDEFKWDNTLKELDITGNILVNGTVDGRDISTDGAALDTHTTDNTIHFTEASIDHTAIQNKGTNTHTQIDTHIADNTVHFTQASIDHNTIANTHNLTTDIDHTTIQNTGSNSHDEIDEHLASGEIHFSEGNQLPVGLPTDGSYGGILPIQETDNVADIFDNMNDLLALISPEAPGNLTGQSLTISITIYSAKLPSGLSGNWGSYTPGDTITTLITNGSYILYSPNTSTRFNAGLTSGDGGTITHILNGSDGDSRDVDQGVGSTGTIQITDISTYNSIWQKVNARINTSQSEGKTQHALKHDIAGTSNTYTIYFDNITTAPSFSVSPTHTVNSETLKYLSGIAYYNTGTEFDVSYTAASGIFEKAYHATQVSRISCTGLTSVTVNPSSPPAFADTFVVSNERVTLNVSNQANVNSPKIAVLLRKPDGQNTTINTPTLTRNICTYGTQSTTTYDNFVDEAQRLVIGTGTSWTSTNALTNGNAQVRAGTLQYPNSGEYPGFTGDQVYERRITKASASNGTIAFAGLSSYTQISSYNTGDLNVFLQLETDGIWFDLGRSFGSNNGTGSGDFPANSKGARNDGGSSGTSLAFTFGTYNTANNSNQYRIRIVFRNTNRTLTSITGT